MRYHVMDGGGFIERTLDNPVGRQILYGVPVCVDTHVNIRPRSYGSREDAQAVADWLNERAAGYPSHNLPWPPDRPIMPHERACAHGRCCVERRAAIERANNAAYHGDIDGDGDY